MKFTQKEIKFLNGPQSMLQDFIFAVKQFIDFVKGLSVLKYSGPCICIFGSARFAPDNIYYKQAQELASRIAELGFTIMTGGGPGIMEAANKGAREVGGKSVGINIELPFEQTENAYLDKFVLIKSFSVRKTLLIKYAYGFVCMPGGFGTMDELFEALTLIQTGKLKNFPVIIFNREYHKNLINFINDMQEQKTISPQDLDLLLITDNITEAVEHIRKCIKQFGLVVTSR